MTDPDGAPPASTTRPVDQGLADAVRVLTEAARLTRPALERATAGDDGDQPEWVDSGRREQADWAEFVTPALGSAAANVDGIEAALAGRPGSWEADGIRILLTSTVGHDEAHLFEHRTEAVVIEVYVDEILSDQDMWKPYDDATQELNRRYEAIATPAEAAAQLEPATDEQERQGEAIGALEDRLEELRLQDWAHYGQALKANIEAGAARRMSLRVAVVVSVDLQTYRGDGRASVWGLSEQLLEEAIEATPLPGDARSPLERLGT